MLTDRDPQKTPSFQLLDLSISAVDLDSAAFRVMQWIEDGYRTYVTVTGVHGIMESHDNAGVLAAHNSAGMIVPDGMPLVYIGRLFGMKIGRVYGPDLMLELFRRSTNKQRHFLYGGNEGVATQLKLRLSELYPCAKVVGVYTPPFRPLTVDEETQIAEIINASRADIVWVGLSTPKQELWMARMRSELTASVLIGVGAAFDFHAGLKSQAPKVMQILALEWFYRLCCEPRRLWKRYLKNNPRFLLLLGRQLLQSVIRGKR